MITKSQTSWVISLRQQWLVEVHESHHLSFVCITALVNLGLFLARVRNNIPGPITFLQFLLADIRMGIMQARHSMGVQKRLCSNLVDCSGKRLVVPSRINPLLLYLSLRIIHSVAGWDTVFLNIAGRRKYVPGEHKRI